MKAFYHKDFKKAYQKLSPQLKEKANERILLCLEDPFNQILNNHALAGRYLGYRSINITGDYRAIYKFINADLILLTNLGTHSELYK